MFPQNSRGARTQIPDTGHTDTHTVRVVCKYVCSTRYYNVRRLWMSEPKRGLCLHVLFTLEPRGDVTVLDGRRTGGGNRSLGLFLFFPPGGA